LPFSTRNEDEPDRYIEMPTMAYVWPTEELQPKRLKDTDGDE
jgi:hypothetical protein